MEKKMEKKIRETGATMELDRLYGVRWIDAIPRRELKEWKGQAYPDFCRALANANAPAFDGGDYAFDAAWDRLQQRLGENEGYPV